MNLLKIKIVFLFTIIYLMNSLAFAQMPERAMEIPVKYITPEEDVSFSMDNNRRPGSFWAVFSDRHGNLTYESAFGKVIKKTVGYMENFYVAEESGNRVHIIKDASYAEGFSQSAEDYGWIEKTNLLLWDHCLITKAGKINKKGMVLNTIESLKSEDVMYGVNIAQAYYDPYLTLVSPTKIKHADILYVYKITDDAILLGKNYITDIYHAKDEIFGWVSTKNITIWDHRIAVEPNWEKEAAKERMNKNIAATFFVDIPRAKRFEEGISVNDRYIVWSTDPYEKRNTGDWRRFPLLDYDKYSGIIKAGVLGNIQYGDSELYFPAYSSMKVNGLSHNLFNLVLFMSLRDLGDLITKFDALADAFTSSNQRAKLKQVWLELLQSHLGEEFTRESAENMTFEKINKKLFGLPGTSELLHTRLADITDPSVVSDNEFYTYILNIKLKRIELDKIYNNKNYEYGFYSYDTQYFWISQDLLP